MNGSKHTPELLHSWKKNSKNEWICIFGCDVNLPPGPAPGPRESGGCLGPKCICGPRGPVCDDGPHPDCPVHGGPDENGIDPSENIEKPTPGPWVISTSADDECEIEVVAPNSGWVTISPGPLKEANAHLIAAAPDGHELLEIVRDFQNGGGNLTASTLMPGDDRTFGDALNQYFTKIKDGS